MSIFQILLISLVQGITEWLPISSSAHVLLAADYFEMGTRDELLINAMAHMGTLLAVLIYFRKDVGNAIMGGFELVASPVSKKPLSAHARLALLILVSMPIALGLSFAVEKFLPQDLQDHLRSLWTVAGATAVFGIFLWWADVNGKTGRTTENMSLMHAFLIGASQAIAAIIPGTSRSGLTMSMARMFGYDRTEAARFSMLIGAPILAAVGAYAVLEFLTSDAGAGQATLKDGLMAAGLSFVSGWASIAILMELLKKISFLPFVIYRFLLAIILVMASPLALNWIAA